MGRSGKLGEDDELVEDSRRFQLLQTPKSNEKSPRRKSPERKPTTGLVPSLAEREREYLAASAASSKGSVGGSMNLHSATEERWRHIDR